MKDKTLVRPLKGIIPPMVTPLTDRNELDVQGLERLIEHILAGGVHGLFILGTSGEAPSLSHQLRQALVHKTCAIVDSRVPVLVGITDTSFVESINLAKEAATAGAQAVVMAPPYYFPAGQPELLEYIEHLMPRLPLPLFLYNAPGFTKLMFEPETVKQAARIPGVIGLKDSSSNMVYFHQLQRLFRDDPDFSLLVGIEELLGETVLLGGHGGVPGGANMFPKLYVALYQAALARDLDEVARLHDRVMQVATAIYSVGKYSSSYFKGLKCALSCMDICTDFMAEPFHRFRQKERDQIIERLDRLDMSDFK
jgi:dihydrodipicolinate synthase/N-acetylneuraminate lyase